MLAIYVALARWLEYIILYHENINPQNDFGFPNHKNSNPQNWPATGILGAYIKFAYNHSLLITYDYPTSMHRGVKPLVVSVFLSVHG